MSDKKPGRLSREDSKKISQKLRELWKSSGENKDKFKELLGQDEFLKGLGQNWDDCDHRAKRMEPPLYKRGEKVSARFWVTKLANEYPDVQKELDADLAKEGPPTMAQILEKFREHGPKSNNDLRNYARVRGIKIKKGKMTDTENTKNLSDLSEEELIAKREKDEVTPEEFVSNLKGDLKRYWSVLCLVLKQKRTFRNIEILSFAKELGVTGRKRVEKLNAIRGILAKFVEWKILSTFKSGTHLQYLCNLPNFYEAEELLKLIPGEETSRILRPFADGPKTLAALEQEMGRTVGVYVLETILNHYVGKDVLEAVKQPKGAFRLTEAAKLTGTDPDSLLALELFEAENLLDEKEEEEAKQLEITNISDLEKLAESDIRSKTIKTVTVDTDPEKNSLRFMCFGELRIGNQFTDYNLLSLGLSEAERVKPDIIISSGMIQGDHRSFQIERVRALMSGPLSRISAQMKAGDLVLRELERSANVAVWDILGDDDWNIAKSRTLIAMKELLGLRRAGYSELFPTEVARLAGRDYVKYLRTQYEYVAQYMHRVGRTLLNKKEVNEIVPGLEKDELLLILMVLLFQKFNHNIPDDFRRVVDLEALMGDKTNSKRRVSCDPVLIEWRGKKLHFIHNTGYSDVTQNLDSLIVMEKSFRQLQARGIKTPNFVFDFQQERFFGTNVGGTFMFNLPGCQNTLLAASRQLKTFNTQIVGEKSHKQNTFRKEPVSSGITDFQVFEDGRFKFRLLNNATRRVLESSRTVPEVRERLALFQDIQVGSPQMRLEWAIKAHDLALYGPNPVQHVSYNGDLIHGFSIYMQFVSESRIKKLVSIKSQQAMFEKCFLPFYPAPTVKHIGRVLGNHEWENLMAKKEGGDPLAFLESALTNKYEMYNDGYRKAMIDSGFKGEVEVPYKDVEIIPYSRGRTRQSGNPEGGGTVHWPFYTKDIGGGFKYAVQHKWQPFGGGGRTPVDLQIKWVTNMAKAARGINVMLGGHYHSFWVAMIADVLALQMPGLIDQSGLELGFGLTPLSLFCMVEFSNKDGITVEMYPMEYLVDYQCRSPFYKDKNELLVRPKPGTREFEYGFDSPLIKQWEDEVDSRHIEV